MSAGPRRWAERLAAALRDDDGDAFIAAYDALLDDAAAYSDEQVEAIKDEARRIYDSDGLLEDTSMPYVAGAGPSASVKCEASSSLEVLQPRAVDQAQGSTPTYGENGHRHDVDASRRMQHAEAQPSVHSGGGHELALALAPAAVPMLRSKQGIGGLGTSSGAADGNARAPQQAEAQLTTGIAELSPARALTAELQLHSKRGGNRPKAPQNGGRSRVAQRAAAHEPPVATSTNKPNVRRREKRDAEVQVGTDAHFRAVDDLADVIKERWLDALEYERARCVGLGLTFSQ